MVVDRQEFTARKNQIDKQLENLKKETSKGKITEETSKKLQEELEKELYIIDKDLTEKLKEESEDLKRESLDIEIEIVKSRERLAALESEKSSYLKEKEELEARFQIKQIAKKEYKTKNRIYAEKIDQIDQFISQVNKRIVKLTERQGMVSQLLKSKEGELNQ
jgi:chromosome segregation ATPase